MTDPLAEGLASTGFSSVLKKTRIILITLLQIGVSAAILVALARSSNWKLLTGTFSGADGKWFGAATAVLVAQQLLGAARWRSISENLGGPKLPHSFYVLWQGMAVLLLQVLPSTIGGDVLRAANAARHDGLRRGVGVVIVDRVIGMAVLCGFVLVGAAVFPALLALEPALFIPLAMGVLGLGGCAIVMLASHWLAKWRLSAPLGALGTALLGSLKGATGLRIGGVSVVIHLLSVISVLCLLESAQAPWTAGVFFVVPSAFLVCAVPISLGGWGVREGAFVVGLGLLGTGRETSLGVSVLFGISLTLAGLVLSVLGATIQGGAHWRARARESKHEPEDES